MNSFYSEDELRTLGLKSIGENVLISRKASIYGAENITIGSNVRIDDFCILSGSISFGSYVHLAAYSALYGGKAGITLSDFSTVSSRVCIYAISDDYSGEALAYPMLPEKYRKVHAGHVTLGKHVIIGTGSTVLPGVYLAEGTAIGAMSLCKQSTDAWGIYAGIPAIRKKERSREILRMEQLLSSE